MGSGPLLAVIDATALLLQPSYVFFFHMLVAIVVIETSMCSLIYNIISNGLMCLVCGIVAMDTATGQYVLCLIKF
jgi:hypothetical protein